MASASDIEPPNPEDLVKGSGIRRHRRPSESSWTLQKAIGLTPKRLGSMITALFDGDTTDFMGFAEELETRDGHYSSQLTILKNSIAALEWGIQGEEGPILDALVDFINNGGVWKKLCKALLDGEAKGYACAELFWGTGGLGELWVPEDVKWVDPRHFGYDGQQIMIRDPDSPDDIEKFRELPPFIFAVYESQRKSGLPYRNGLALPCSVMHLFKSNGFKDWVQFLAIFGMPVRVGKYSEATKDEDVQKLQDAVDSIGEFAAAVIPMGTNIDVMASSTKAGGEAFNGLIDVCNREMSKVVNGQTMTSDDGSSLSQAKVHDLVRHDIAESVAEGLAEALTKTVIRPMICLNWGPQHAAKFAVSVAFDEAEDLEAATKSVKTMVDMGMEIKETEAHERLGWEIPEEGDVVLTSGGRKVFKESPEDDGDGDGDDDPPPPEPDPEPGDGDGEE